MEKNRVLSRVGARLLSEEELHQISGGFSTGACVWDPITLQAYQRRLPETATGLR